MAKLSKATIELIEAAGGTEIADDYVVLGNTDLRILLSHRAVLDLNAQAREMAELGAAAQAAQGGEQ